MEHDRESYMTINEDFVERINDLARSIVDFHERFGIENASNMNNMNFRQQLLMEEVGEVSRAITRGQYEQAVLESVDVAYVALGTLLSHAPQSFTYIVDTVIKNDAKTLDTHEPNWDGKVLRRRVI